MAINQGIAIGGAVANFQGFSFHDTIAKLSQWGPIETIIGSPESLENQVRNALQSLGRAATGLVLSIATNIPEIALQVFISVITCFFLLMDGKKFMHWMQDKIPLDEEVRQKIVSSFQNTTVSVIWATLAAAGAQALCMILGFWILGVPGAVLAGGATFVFAWIPILGSVPVWIAGAIYLYTQGAIVKLIVMIIIGIFTGIVDNIVRPWVLSGRDETHPLVSLIAIFGGIQLFGIFGVFIGPIVVAILLTMLDIWPTLAQRARLMSPTTTRIVLDTSPPPVVPSDNTPHSD
jgi:predicted PurR-regulated permease PerM